ncbi:MAG: oxidase [Pseudomonadota bacterium]|nr:oxidase [Pseudomonadota bacterium]
MRVPMPRSLEISDEDKRVLWRHMRKPAITFVALLVMLGVIVLLGAFLPFSKAWIIEASVATLMVVTVLLFSMEVLEEAPLMRVFAGLGFFWVAILFGITLIDYLTR